MNNDNNKDEFFVTLSSNSGGAYYNSNTLTHFRNQLPETVDLQDKDWEVGLAECILPYNWLHISEEDELIEAERDVQTTATSKEQNITFLRDTTKIESGLYKTPKGFVETLFARLKGLETPIAQQLQTTYNARTHKAQLRVMAETRLVVSRRVMAILDFDENAQTVTKRAADGRFVLSQGTYRTQGCVDLSGGLKTLWVYSDIVEHRIVEEKKVPLLRILTTQDRTSEDYYQHNFDNIHYFPIRQTLFQSIEIDIRDSQGFPVPFEAGQVIVTLHFRHRRRQRRENS